MSWGTLTSTCPVDEWAATASSKEYEIWEKVTPWFGATMIPPCEAQSCALAVEAKINDARIMVARSVSLLFMVTSFGHRLCGNSFLRGAASPRSCSSGSMLRYNCDDFLHDDAGPSSTISAYELFELVGVLLPH